MIDKALITRKAKLIIADLSDLEEIANLTLKEFLDDRIKQAVAERYLERLIGRMIDINFHLLVETENPPPSDYFSSFTDLAKINALPADFARDIAPAAGLRNRVWYTSTIAWIRPRSSRGSRRRFAMFRSILII